MKNYFRFGTIVWFLFFCVPAAWAATITGVVQDPAGGPIVGTVQVRAWKTDARTQTGYWGYYLAATANTDNAGNYTLTVPNGTYKLDAVLRRLSGPTYPTGQSSFWVADRWGYPATFGDTYRWTQVQGTTVTVSSNMTNVNFRLDTSGAAEGVVWGYANATTTTRTALPYMQVRFEDTADTHRHHVAITEPARAVQPGYPARTGRFRARGLRTGRVHRMMVYDPMGYNETLLHGTTMTPVLNTLQNYGTINLSKYNAEPYPDARTANGQNILRSQINPIFRTSGARIAPRGAVNRFCWDVQPEDRFIVTATTYGNPIATAYHPWVDPLLRVVNKLTPTTPIHSEATNRYWGSNSLPFTAPTQVATGPLDARVDTGRITSSATYCAVVTVANDTAFSGANQVTPGRYVLDVRFGNRPPSVTIFNQTNENPPSATIGAGTGTLTLDIVFSDPENNTLTRTFSAPSLPAPAPVFTSTSGTTNTWSWTPPIGTPAGSYPVTFTAHDGEFPTSRTINVLVGNVNFPPTTPVLESPVGGTIVTTATPTLRMNKSTDPNGDTIYYDIEIYYDAPVGARAQYISGLTAVGDFVTAIPAPLPEKRTIYWRALADDTQLTSDWSAFGSFFVHAMPPELEVSHEEVLVTAPVSIDEGDFLALDLLYWAPHAPIPDLNFTMTDVHGALVTDADLQLMDSGTPNVGAALFTWPVGPRDSENSPYLISFVVSDGVLSTVEHVQVDVLFLNLPPSAPVILQPEDQANIATRFPTILAANAEDPEEEALFLHFEVASDVDFNSIVDHSPAGGVEQSVTGETEWTVTTGLQWSHTYYVRAYATDASGLEGPNSATHSFFVLPRTAPTIVEPADADDVSSRWPTITATNAVDPAGEPLFLHFEVATDDAFTDVVEDSGLPGEPQDASGSTSWTLTEALLWDGTYYVRARAYDADGLAGPISNVHEFTVLPRTAPIIVDPAAGATVSSREPTIIVENASDPDESALFLMFEIASDIGFTNVVANNELPGIAQDESGQTGWQVTPILTFGETYYVRVTAIDEVEFPGPTSEIVQFAVRANQAPSSSTLGGPFAAQCTSAVVTENPLVVPVTHGTDPDGDPVSLQLQVYRHGTDPETAVDIDMLVDANVSGDVTDISVDIGTLPDNTRFTIRVRSYDGIDYSSWHTCDFWNNTRNTPPTALEILTPTPGTILALNTTEVTVTVQNAYDPDSVVPGSSLQIAWCSSLDETFADCPASVSDWNLLPQSSLDPADTTDFVVGGITNREAWYIRACAMDETGVCGPSDETWVLADGTDGNGGDGVDPGCCTTSRGGDPWLAFFAVFALVFFAPRRRRRSVA